MGGKEHLTGLKTYLRGFIQSLFGASWQRFFFLSVSFRFVVGKVRISKLRPRNRLRGCLRSEAREAQARSLTSFCAPGCGFWSHHPAFPARSPHELCTTTSRRYPGLREPRPRPAGSLGTGRRSGARRCTGSTGRVPASLSITRGLLIPHLTEIPSLVLFFCPQTFCSSLPCVVFPVW